MTTEIKAISKDLFQKKLNKLYNNWAKEYRSVMSGSDTLDEQIKFIGEYLGYMALAGSHEQNLERISYFLAMQTPESEGESVMVQREMDFGPFELNYLGRRKVYEKETSQLHT